MHEEIPLSNAIPAEYYLDRESREPIPLRCQRCNIVFETYRRFIVSNLRRGRSTFCSLSCSSKEKQFRLGKRPQKTTCSQCQQLFAKSVHEINRTKNNFCSRSCAAKYNNRNKTHGYRSSQLEHYLTEQIRQRYPHLQVVTHNRSLVGYELDIYLPEINLAFEVNGIVHQKPIYGEVKFQKIKQIDSVKRKRCKELKVDLIIIDANAHFTERLKISRWHIVQAAIERRHATAQVYCLHDSDDSHNSDSGHTAA